jgi:hypothetical protein
LRDEHPSRSLLNELFKQMGNSIYGKTCQGLSGRTSLNPRTGATETIGRSALTNPYIASYVTSLVRAAAGEIVARNPGEALSVTTDALITSAPLDQLDTNGPACRVLSAARLEIANTPVILEVKYGGRQLLPWRTRGIATLVPEPGLKSKLAKGGIQTPGGIDDAAANDLIRRLVLNRRPGDLVASRHPPDFRRSTLELSNRAPDPKAVRYHDFVFDDDQRALNGDFDWKRKPVRPRMETVRLDDGSAFEHLAFETEPWETIDDFIPWREAFDRWRTRKDARRILGTTADLQDFIDYMAGADATALGINRSTRGIVDQARRLIVQAYAVGAWGLPGGNFKAAASALTTAGYPTSEKDFKNARQRPKPLPETGAFPADAIGIPDFIAAVRRLWPTCETERLLRSADIVPMSHDTTRLIS